MIYMLFQFLYFPPAHWHRRVEDIVLALVCLSVCPSMCVIGNKLIQQRSSKTRVQTDHYQI